MTTPLVDRISDLACISFAVPGHPEPAGSKRAFIIGGHANVVDANPKASKWKLCVASFATKMLADGNHCMPITDGPVHLTLKFKLQRPKGHYRSGKNAALLKDSAPAQHTTKPDVLKLARGVEDALTGILYVDDAQIVLETLSKEYGESEGVEVWMEYGRRR